MTSTYSCRVCSKPSYGQVHKKCQRETRFAVVEDVALTGGAWVPRDGIMRWEVAS